MYCAYDLLRSTIKFTTKFRGKTCMVVGQKLEPMLDWYTCECMWYQESTSIKVCKNIHVGIIVFILVNIDI